MNTLSLKRNAYRYEIDGQPWPDPHVQTDYIVDGASLAEAFQFESKRPWFGQTCFEYDGDTFDQGVRQLRGLAPPSNQFGTNRFVLYRCHCGDDNCGIISCVIERGDSVVRWRDLRFENDGGPEEEVMFQGVIPLFEFDLMAYDNAVAACARDVG